MNTTRKFTLLALALLPLAQNGPLRTAIGAELRPYSLPSQRAEPRYEPRQMEQKAIRPQISEQYYRDFEQKAKKLKPAQRADLIRSFQGSRDQAIKAGRLDEAQHYVRLLEIVREIK